MYHHPPQRGVALPEECHKFGNVVQHVILHQDSLLEKFQRPFTKPGNTVHVRPGDSSHVFKRVVEGSPGGPEAFPFQHQIYSYPFVKSYFNRNSFVYLPKTVYKFIPNNIARIIHRYELRNVGSEINFLKARNKN